MKKILSSIINILFFIIWIILTVYNFITINISFTLFEEFSKVWSYLDIMMFLMYYLPLLLWIIIVFIFYRNISKNKISKNYAYSYGIFVVLFILYYVFVFNNAKVEYIPKENFQTIHHDKEFSSEDNAYNSVNDFDPQLAYDIQDFKIYCVNDISCSEEQREKTIIESTEYLEKNILTYIEFVEWIKNITQKEFIKSEKEFWSFLKVRWIISSLKFQKIVDKKYIENNQFNLVLDYYNNMYKYSNLLLQSDNWLISSIIWSSIRSTILDNFDYLIKTDSLDKKQIILLSTLIETNKINDIDLIYSNMIKSEYLSSFDIDAKINNSLLFNYEEFLNFRRYVLQNKYILEEKINVSMSRLPITQVWIYNIFSLDINYVNYQKDLIDVIKKEEEFVKSGKLGDY